MLRAIPFHYPCPLAHPTSGSIVFDTQYAWRVEGSFSIREKVRRGRKKGVPY